MRIERGRPRAALDEPRRERRMGRGLRLDARAPEIRCEFEAQARVIGLHLERERHPRCKRRLLQRTLAKRVDRVDRGLIERRERAAHTLGGQLERHVVGIGKNSFEKARDKRVAVAIAPLDGALELGEPRADPLVQLRRRRLRERHDEDLIRVQIALEHQAHIERTDVPGLARAGGRLDLIHAVEPAAEHVELDRCGERRGRGPVPFAVHASSPLR